ncbi:MAG: DUF4197 domain-containing protein [Erythrobacter sp.]|uniref:DUF4197 domain-containing protein n=1 Tax=Erythrobacter sp. TaxID=1042 RepID=UPI0032EEE74F
MRNHHLAARRSFRADRRFVIAGLAACGIAGMITPRSARAQGLGLSSILGRATDSALDKLARPGAFYDDEDIRIGLPLVGKPSSGLLGRIMQAGDQLGVLGGITRSINDAAGSAAGEAKPIFREAIDGLSWADAPGIVSESDGGTQYLRRSSNDALSGKLSPLVDDALGEVGVYDQFDGLADKHSFIREAGLNRESINRSVTEQALDGIFSYIGKEERAFRKDPIGNLGGALGDLLGRE